MIGLSVARDFIERGEERRAIERAAGMSGEALVQRLRSLGLRRDVVASAARDYAGDPGAFWAHLEAVAAANSEQESYARMQAILGASGPVDMGKLSLARLEGLARHAALRSLAVSWRGESVLMLGPTGVGKTATAVALVRRSRSAKVAWQSGESLLLSQRRHPLGQGDPPEYQRAVAASLLVVDDPDWVRSRDGDELFAMVCAARERRGLPMIVTSGSTKQQFQERYGLAVLRRIIESSRDADGKPTGRLVNCHEVTHGPSEG